MKFSIMQPVTGVITGKHTDLPERTVITTTAESESPGTFWVPSNANKAGSAEVPEPAKEVDGAVDMTDALRPLFLIRLQDWQQTTEDNHKVVEVLITRTSYTKASHMYLSHL